MFAARVSPYAACFTTAETFFELNQFYLRRAWGMTAKVRRYLIAVSLAWPMRFVAGNKTPREAGKRNVKKMAEQQAAGGETRTASPSKKTRHGENTKQKFSSLAELPKALNQIYVPKLIIRVN